MTTSLHRILFGALVLSDGTTDRPMDTDYWFSVKGENFSTGQPEPIVRTIESFMLDGAHVIKDGDGNRQMTCFVGIKGPDTQALTAGEVALTLETGKRNSFIIETHDDFGPPTLFEVVMSSFGQVPDDLAEVMRCERVFALEITALPQAFSTTVTITPALSSAAVPTVTTISDGTSAAGWTSPDGAVGLSSGRLAVPTSTWAFTSSSPTYDTYFATVETTKALSPVVDFSAAPYISADVAPALPNQTFVGSVSSAVTAEVDGIVVTLVATTWVSATSMWRLTWRSTDASASTLTIKANMELQVPTGAGSTASSLLIDNVSRSDGAPQTGTARQKMRTITVPGSVRTPGTLMVSHPTAALGDVLVHTCVDMGNGYTPAVSRFGTYTSVDTSLVSGLKKAGTSFFTDVPVSTLTPGTYQIMVRAKRTTSSGVVAVNWSTQARLGSTDFGPVRGDSRSLSLGSTDYSIFTLATVELPTDRTGPNSTAVQRVTISASPTSLDIDEVWLFFLGDHLGNRGHLTQVACGTGTPAAGGASNRVFIKSATIDDPLPGVFIGTQADESDSRFAADALWDQHSFSPGALLTTTVTTGTLDAETSFAARDAGHSHAPS